MIARIITALPTFRMLVASVAAAGFTMLVIPGTGSTAGDSWSISSRGAIPPRPPHQILDKTTTTEAPASLHTPVLPSGDCSDFVDLSGLELPITYNGSTVGATNNYGPFPYQPECWEWGWYANSGAAADVTLKWTVPATGKYTISLCGSSFDTCLLVYRFTCPTEPVFPDDFICGDDDADCGYQSELFALELEAGQEILIVVDGYSGSGPFQLMISEYQRAPDLDTYINQTMLTEHIPGMVICALMHGQLVLSEAYGWADIQHGTAVADTTAFLLASISKAVVGTSLMQLWEEGLFDLEDDINAYLPFEVHNPFYPDSVITFRALMTHTSSLRDNINVLTSVITWGGDSPIALDQFLADYLTPGGTYYGLGNFGNWPPGQRYYYCNVGGALAGLLVEEIAGAAGLGTTLASFCQDSLFVPLDMDRTSWFLADIDSTTVAIPYRWTGFDYVRYPHYGGPWYPAFQVRTSALDLSRLLIAVMECEEFGGPAILECPTAELMTTIQYPQISPLYGLLWSREHYGGRWVWGHTGGFYGCVTAMYYSPEEHIGVVVLTNGESLAMFRVAHEIFESVVASTSVPRGEPPPATPALVTLRQNHPNPFNPVTVLIYNLSRPGRITLNVYDTLGRCVAALDQGWRQPGEHRVMWNAAGLSSGAYFAQLEDSGDVRTVKMTLVR